MNVILLELVVVYAEQHSHLYALALSLGWMLSSKCCICGGD